MLIFTPFRTHFHNQILSNSSFLPVMLLPINQKSDTPQHPYHLGHVDWQRQRGPSSYSSVPSISLNHHQSLASNFRALHVFYSGSANHIASITQYFIKVSISGGFFLSLGCTRQSTIILLSSSQNTVVATGTIGTNLDWGIPRVVLDPAAYQRNQNIRK